LNYRETETEFVKLAKEVMRINNCSFPEAAEQLISLRRGPGKYRKVSRIGKNKSKTKKEKD